MQIFFRFTDQIMSSLKLKQHLKNLPKLSETQKVYSCQYLPNGCEEIMDQIFVVSVTFNYVDKVINITSLEDIPSTHPCQYKHTLSSCEGRSIDENNEKQTNCYRRKNEDEDLKTAKRSTLNSRRKKGEITESIKENIKQQL